MSTHKAQVDPREQLKALRDADTAINQDDIARLIVFLNDAFKQVDDYETLAYYFITYPSIEEIRISLEADCEECAEREWIEEFTPSCINTNVELRIGGRWHGWGDPVFNENGGQGISDTAFDEMQWLAGEELTPDTVAQRLEQAHQRADKFLRELIATHANYQANREETDK